eukprot:scaffold167980_cov33-Tisochrysis_lutea.AAC.2
MALLEHRGKVVNSGHSRVGEASAMLRHAQCSLQSAAPHGGGSMAVVHDVAGATGRVARPGAARTCCGPSACRTRLLHLRPLHGGLWGALGGGPEGEGSRVGVLHGDQV